MPQKRKAFLTRSSRQRGHTLQCAQNAIFAQSILSPILSSGAWKPATPASSELALGRKPISRLSRPFIMSKSEIVGAMARAMWVSDPRVNQIAWTQGDPQTKDLYRIMASAAQHVTTKR